MNNFIEDVCDFFKGISFAIATFVGTAFVLGAIAVVILGLVNLVSPNTGKVAKQLNCQFIGIEISSEYLEIAKNRINNIKESE